MTSSARRTRIAGISIGVMFLLALVIRLVSDRHQPAMRADAPALDDSQVPISTSPPPVPADSMQQMREVFLQLKLPISSMPVPQQIQAAEMARGIGDLWRTEDILRVALRQAPNDRKARLLLAETMSQQERFGPARQLYLQLNQEDPRDLEPYLQLHSIALREDKRAEAWKWLSLGVEQSAQTAKNMFTLAHRYYYLNDFSGAKSTLARASRIAPDDENVQLQSAIFYFERGQFAESRSILEDMVKSHADNEAAQRLLAGVLIHPAYPEQDAARANALLERAVALNAKDSEIYRLAATTYRRLRLFRMATEAYIALLTLEPRSTDGRFGLGQMYVQFGKQDLAATQFSLYHNLLAQEQRIASLSSAVSQHPGSAAAHAALAKGLEAGGDYAGALREWQVAAGLAPDNRAIEVSLVELYGRLGWGKPERRAH